MSSENSYVKCVEILLVEDSPEDAELTRIGLKRSKLSNKLHVVTDGEEALSYLRNESPYEKSVKPDLILLDLNLPKKSGLEVLKEIREDSELTYLPVVILTTSENDEDIIKSYNLHVNCYITKPLDANDFFKVVKYIDDFWFSIVKLPRENK